MTFSVDGESLANWDDARTLMLEAAGELREVVDRLGGAATMDSAVGADLERAMGATDAIVAVLAAADRLLASRSALGYCRADYPAAPLEPIGDPGSTSIRWCCLHAATHCYDS